jgi:hypothetical protein
MRAHIVVAFEAKRGCRPGPRGRPQKPVEIPGHVDAAVPLTLPPATTLNTITDHPPAVTGMAFSRTHRNPTHDQGP